MEEDQKKKIIANILDTEIGRDLLIAGMVIPIRCGGSYYEDGVRYIKIGGVAYTEEELEKKIEQTKKEKIETVYKKHGEKKVLAFLKEYLVPRIKEKMKKEKDKC